MHSATVLPSTPGWLFLGQKMLEGKEASQVCVEGRRGVSKGIPGGLTQRPRRQKNGV